MAVIEKNVVNDVVAVNKTPDDVVAIDHLHSLSSRALHRHNIDIRLIPF